MKRSSSNDKDHRRSSRSTWLAGLSVVAALLFAQFARAQDSVQWKTNYYAITGGTLPEIHRSLSQSRPWKSKSTADGMTEWRIDWRMSVVPSTNGCRLSSFTTKTTITITLPRWVAPTTASPTVAGIWLGYLKALEQHERGHAQFPLAAVAEMSKRVREVAPNRDCDSLRRTIDEMCRGVVRDSRQREKEYDQTTRHGATQGAVLPRGEQVAGRRRE